MCDEYYKSGSGPLLIYLPGMEGTGRLFFRQEPALARHFTVVALPLRRHLPFDYEEMCADLLSVLHAEGADTATVVGESFGGTVALQFAIRYPNHVNRLVLVNTFPYFRRRKLLRLARMLLPLAFTMPGAVVRKTLFQLLLRHEKMDDTAISRLLECSFSHGYAVSRHRLDLIAHLDIRQELNKISAPVTIIASGRDKVVPSVKEGKFMSTKIGQARVVVLPDYGHTCLLVPDFSLLSVIADEVQKKEAQSAD